MACVSSTSFSMSINGSLYGFFKGKRGLRQGDPMSPYLFTLAMEVLTLILHKQVSLSLEYRFHNKCEKQRIINLFFAYNLFLFARGDHRSSRVVMEALNIFKNMSGLVPSMTKSTAIFGNVADAVKRRILSIMQFEEGKLPVWYLGVPLISTRLHYKDCKRLIDNMDARITDWKNKCLSFAGRVQLIRSVLSSLHVYWASVFILPKRITLELEDRMRRNRSFWDVPVKNNITWSWRKMLGMRPMIRDHVWINVGNGANTRVWFDKWDDVCPISSIVTPRLIANAGFNMNTKLVDVYVNGEWDISLNQSRQDKVVWTSRRGHHSEFSAATAWDDLRVGQDEVNWAKVVWFPQAIPRHSFIMWLIVQKKLKTQDVIRGWNSSDNANFNLMCCSLCTSKPDSHEHLFFECGYASSIWNGVKEKAGMSSIQNKWDSILDFLVGNATSTKATHIIAKLVVSATAYFVWEERNRRLFSTKRSADQLVEVILSTVRLKLHTMKFKTTIHTVRVLQEWALSRGLLITDDDCG
ncbi:uncharacterized protein LOC110868702 [Helianthus annuus]|uniref:uncharacterized protein LOC110868702 n=1 Tax=Helianthus annuus TaxID=4232 RepID=UPI000B8F340C|nr:uncharacterized protein LOC110868702 [Helianthus annuus]